VIRKLFPVLPLAALLLFCGPVPRGWAYRILYAEQYYKLYHLHFYQYPDDSMENIYYLEQALQADFANPLYALARIENREQWAQYRMLFKMHVNLKLVELYLTLGSKYDKQAAYFYNAPWRDQNLDSLRTAEQVYRLAVGYWKEARGWAFRLPRLYFNLEEIQGWEDERARILSGDLDYGRIIDGHLSRLDRVRRQFGAMDENTY
jgi:hypothetical protein